MNRDRIKGKLEELEGKVKKRIGGATGDTSTQAEGWMEEQKGKVRKGVGELEDEAERARRDDPARDRP